MLGPTRVIAHLLLGRSGRYEGPTLVIMSLYNKFSLSTKIKGRKGHNDGPLWEKFDRE